MEKYQLIILIIFFVMLSPISLILSALRHEKVSREKVVKQKFEIITLVFEIIVEMLKLGFGTTLFFLSLIIFTIIFNQPKFDLIIIVIYFFLSILSSILSYLFIKSSIYFFRHLYIESARELYYEKETEKIIVNKKDQENYIILNSPNVKIVEYITPYNRLINLGKIEIHNNGEIIVISSLLDLTPELYEKIIKADRKIITRKFNWI